MMKQMKVGDLIEYTDDCNDRLGTHGLIVAAVTLINGKEIEPPLVEILWETGEIERVFEDEIKVINRNC